MGESRGTSEGCWIQRGQKEILWVPEVKAEYKDDYDAVENDGRDLVGIWFRSGSHFEWLFPRVLFEEGDFVDVDADKFDQLVKLKDIQFPVEKVLNSK